MSFMDYFRANRKKSADIAKERLQIIVAHERSRRGNNPRAVNLQLLQQKLVHVISEFFHIDENEFQVELEHDDDRAVLELNVTLPDKETVTTD